MLSRHHAASLTLAVATILAAACGNETARAPSPAEYDWPDSLAYRIDYVSDARRDSVTLLRYVEQKRLNLRLRDERYLAWHDSVLKTSHVPGGGLAVLPLGPQDTLAYYLGLGRYGEVTDVQLGCDPVVRTCLEAMPSAIRFELRRLMPRLPVWLAPRGGTWTDTLAWDEAARPGGSRGTVVTTYNPVRDTAVSGGEYWLVSWSAVRRAFRPVDPRGAAALSAETPVAEAGITLVDKRRLLPVYTTWMGTVAVPEQLRALGANEAGFRGRAYLIGTRFDSLFASERQ